MQRKATGEQASEPLAVPADVFGYRSALPKPGYQSRKTSRTGLIGDEGGKPRAVKTSYQPQALETGVSMPPDDDVIEKLDAERLGGIGDLEGHVDVGGRG